MAFAWRCPYCNHDVTITDSNFSTDVHYFDERNKDGFLGISTQVIVCPNKECKEYTISAYLWSAERTNRGPKLTSESLFTWQLKPQSQAKTYPSYIPKAIIDDYNEACLIKDLSPKASATLSRRCLQGIIRDFWGISKGRLIDELNELQGKTEPATWAAIDAVRRIGNIGAHMERDINVIVDDLTPNYVPTLIRELSTFFILQSGRRSVAEPGGLQLAAKAAGVI